MAASIYVLLSPQADAIHRWFVGQQWRGYDLAYYGNSIYGNVAAIQQGGQYTFFANGVLILTAPVPDITSVEELVHLPMLFVPRPRKVLVVSGGVGGVLNEILKYPVEGMVQQGCQRRRVFHSRQFQRAATCSLAPLELVVVTEELQQRQQPLGHATVNLQVRAQPTMQRLRQTGGTVEQAQDIPYGPHDGL